MIHELKTWPNQFTLVQSGQQKCQVRNCFDRDFAVGDTLLLRKYDPNASYTGRTNKGSYISKEGHTRLLPSEADSLQVVVTHIMPSGSVLLETHTCVMSVELVQGWVVKRSQGTP